MTVRFVGGPRDGSVVSWVGPAPAVLVVDDSDGRYLLNGGVFFWRQDRRHG